MDNVKKAENVDEYISVYPEKIRSRLQKLREIIKKAAPEATEKIAYGMPAYAYKGILIYFAAHTNHIGLYPYPSAMEKFRKEIAGYRTSKGTIQLSNDEPLPVSLISDIVKFRIGENEKKEEEKNLKKKIRKQ